MEVGIERVWCRSELTCINDRDGDQEQLWTEYYRHSELGGVENRKAAKILHDHIPVCRQRISFQTTFVD
jgi:hypothetical protein